MSVLFVVAHPEPQSFNGSLVRLGQKYFEDHGQCVEVIDLYGLGFDPVEKSEHYANRLNDEVFSPLAEQRHAFSSKSLSPIIQDQISKLENADLVIFQFPIWWHSIPAILKGWMDRVFISGGLYTSSMRYDRGYFRGKKAICSFTTGAPQEAFVLGGRGGDVDQILWSTQFSLHYMGFEVLPPHGSFGVAGHGFSYVDDAAFQKQFAALESNWLKRLGGISNDTPLTYPGWEDWDELGQPKLSHKD